MHSYILKDLWQWFPPPERWFPRKRNCGFLSPDSRDTEAGIFTNCEGFECEHGLSIWVEYKGEEYLVDTGASGMFKNNADKLGVDLSKVKTAFLSHAHYDHSGGYNEFFAENKTAKVYLQQEAAEKHYFKILGPVKKYIGIPEGILETYKERFEYVDGYKDLGNGIYILPHTTEGLEMRGKHAHMYCKHIHCKDAGKIKADDFTHEQSVVFDTEDGLVIFNSCSHGGVDNIIEEVKAEFPGKKIRAFFGGFHMMGAAGPSTCSFTKEEVQTVAKKIKNGCDAIFYSGHCTGTVAYEYLEEVLGERLQPLHSGLVVEL